MEYVHCIKTELYLAKWKWILRSGPKLKMLVKFHRSNGSFPNPLNWWWIRFVCTALDQCYWNKENWFGQEPDLLLAKYFYNWYFTFMPGSTPPPPNINKINSSVHTGRFDLTSPDFKAAPLTTGPLQPWCLINLERVHVAQLWAGTLMAGTRGGGEGVGEGVKHQKSLPYDSLSLFLQCCTLAVATATKYSFYYLLVLRPDLHL